MLFPRVQGAATACAAAAQQQQQMPFEKKKGSRKVKVKQDERRPGMSEALVVCEEALEDIKAPLEPTTSPRVVTRSKRARSVGGAGAVPGELVRKPTYDAR